MIPLSFEFNYLRKWLKVSNLFSGPISQVSFVEFQSLSISKILYNSFLDQSIHVLNNIHIKMQVERKGYMDYKKKYKEEEENWNRTKEKN